MGCCGSVVIDREISHAVNMGELVTIMERKKTNISKEIEQINEYLKNKTNKVTVAKVDDLTDDELKLRVPYLEKLVSCYEEVINIMKTHKNLPFQETKEHLYNIVSHHIVCYDPAQSYLKDLEKFRKFSSKNQ